ncbi:MAG TPA: lactate racemase domain-containing protein [Gemmataceae bacterium]|nr:lactate racemase domain-containing protein [Gemmataceae bacterium]
MRYPKMLRIRQQFARQRIDNVPLAVRTALDALDLGRTIRPGQTVALTAGSRGIANIPLILRSVASFLKDLGAHPFLVPAMGSHGGGTADGQRQILESYGITEAFVGVPIRASMEVVSLGTTSEGFPVVLDRHASEADHIGIIGRIKPHTGYHGPIESGLLKMTMIGLGKHAGALAYHRILLEVPFDQVVRSISRTVRAHAPIAFGLGLVENAYEETAHIEGVRPEDFESREEQMLLLAKRWLARLPLRQADLLIVDEIGKDISGSGMDTNVVGRKRAFRTAPAPEDQPAMRHIFVRGLSERTHGNATGIGNADFTTTRLIRAMDYRATVINCLTAGYPEGANLPVHFDTDREVLDAALAILGTRQSQDARILRIRNTLHLEDVEISEPCLAEPNKVNTFAVSDSATDLTFEAGGNLPPLHTEHGS